jgi:hypothetical protein
MHACCCSWHSALQLRSSCAWEVDHQKAIPKAISSDASFGRVVNTFSPICLLVFSSSRLFKYKGGRMSGLGLREDYLATGRQYTSNRAGAPISRAAVGDEAPLEPMVIADAHQAMCNRAPWWS